MTQEDPALAAPLLEQGGKIEAIAILGPAGSFQRWPLASAIKLQGELSDAIAAAVHQRRVSDPEPEGGDGEEKDDG